MAKRISVGSILLLLAIVLYAPWDHSTTAQQADRPEFVLVYVPLEWDSSMNEFQRLCQQHSQWFLDMSGIEQYANVRVEYVAEIMRESNLKRNSLDERVVRFGAKRVIGDVYVGLTYRDVGDKNVAGWTHFGGQGIVGEIDRPYLVAHELGHTFGLCDEYHFDDWSRQNRVLRNGCPNPFPDHCERDVRSRDYCTGTAVGNGYCIMGNSAYEESFCHYCVDHLESEFARRFGEPLILPTATQLAVFTPQPTRTPHPLLTPEPASTHRPTLPPPPATPTWPSGPTPPSGGATDTPKPPATSMPSPTPHPTAYQITFISEQDGLFHMYRLDASDRSLIRLYTSTEPIYQPACSADGKKIAFVLTGADRWDIYVLEVETGDAYQATSHVAQDTYPTWLSDGRLAFISEREEGYGIYEIASLDQPPRLMLPLSGGEYDPAFSPMGDEVAVLAPSADGYAIQLYSLSTGASQMVISGKGVASSTSWSLDGSQLLYTLFGETRAQLRTVTRDGILTDITAESLNTAYGAWTPHPGRVVFASDADGDWEIYSMELGTGQVQPLTRNQYSDLYPMVSQ